MDGRWVGSGGRDMGGRGGVWDAETRQDGKMAERDRMGKQGRKDGFSLSSVGKIYSLFFLS